MAPPRKQQERLTSTQLGAEDLDETSIGIAQEGVYPEGYENAPEHWKKAWDNSARAKNTEKAAFQQANSAEPE